MSSLKRNALGRGLSALLDDRDNAESLENNNPKPAESKSSPNTGVQAISIENIEVNPFQPRSEFNIQALEELSESIKVHGIIQPITVREMQPNHYQLISGERRLRASKMAGLTHIPAYIRMAADQGMHEMALIENIQRENLNSLEVAIGLQRMLEECNLKQEELGERVSKSRSTITNYLRLLKLPAQIQSGIKEEKISMGHAKALINVEHIEKQLWIYNQIILNDLSVRKTEELAREIQSQAKSKAKPEPEKSNNREYTKIQDRLSSHFGTRVLVKLSGEDRGKIEIPFLSTPDLNRILELINE